MVRGVCKACDGTIPEIRYTSPHLRNLCKHIKHLCNTCILERLGDRNPPKCDTCPFVLNEIQDKYFIFEYIPGGAAGPSGFDGLEPIQCTNCKLETVAEEYLTDECDHPRDVCDNCMRGYLRNEVVRAQRLDVRCPSECCTGQFSDEHIERFGDKTTKLVYLDLQMRSAVEDDPEFVECANPFCLWWQLHTGGDTNPIVQCQNCKHRTCFIHRVLWDDDTVCNTLCNHDDEDDDNECEHLPMATRSCAICCAEDIPVIEPSVSPSCEHERTFCNGCLERYLHEECVVKSKLTAGVACLGENCKVILGEAEIRRHARSDTIEELDRLAVRALYEKNPEFLECANGDCNYYCLHPGGRDRPIMECPACGMRTCFNHKMPWHENQTCAMYERSQDDKVLLSDGTVQRCPRCDIPIQKNGGCNHMICESGKGCGGSFTWTAKN